MLKAFLRGPLGMDNKFTVRHWRTDTVWLVEHDHGAKGSNVNILHRISAVNMNCFHYQGI